MTTLIDKKLSVKKLQFSQLSFVIQFLQMMKPGNQLGEDIIAAYAPYKNTKTVWKSTNVGKTQFRLPDTYEIVQAIGSGAYSTVAAAIDHSCTQPDKKMVAIKKMTNVFEHKIFARRILRELKMLRLMKHENIVELKTIILPQSRFQFQTIYCVFQFVQKDLFSFIKQKKQILPEYYQMIIYQILRGLKYIHSAQIVHRDLKPRNILIDANCDVKLCDFGLSRHIDTMQKNSAMTDYVITRWYRPPELLLGETIYTTAIDIWSIGCIIVQMLTKRAFLPATNSKQQLQLICETVEVPEKNKNQHSGKILDEIMKRKKKANKVGLLQNKIANMSTDLKDLIRKMLKFEASERITVFEALKHPYLKDFHIEEDEPSRQPIPRSQFEFENYNLTTEQLKDLLYEQILLYHNQQFRDNYHKKINNNDSVVAHIVANSNASKIDPNTDYDPDEDEDN